MALVSCTNNCPIPSLFDCEAKFKSWKHPYYTLVETDTNWCFSGSLNFNWECTQCKRKPIKVSYIGSSGTNNKGTVDSPTPQAVFEMQETGQGLSLARINQVYPNPSDGIFHLDLEIAQENSLVELIALDLKGKTVFQKTYRNVPHSIFHTKNDISSLANGLYLLKVEVNGVVIGSSKITISK